MDIQQIKDRRQKIVDKQNLCINITDSNDSLQEWVMFYDYMLCQIIYEPENAREIALAATGVERL